MSAPALDSGLRILELIVERGEIGFNQLKLHLDIPSASLNRYLKVLVDREFIEKDEQQQYRVGLKFRSMANAADSDDIGQFAAPVLEQISAMTGHTSLWIDWTNGYMAVRDKCVAPEGMSMQPIGQKRTDYAIQPWGYLFLGNFDAERRQFLLENGNLGTFTGQVPAKEQVEIAVEQAAREGFYDDQGTIYIYSQIRRIAVPIGINGIIKAALCVGMAGSDYPEEHVQKVIGILQQKAQDIQKIWEAQSKHDKGAV
jgi:DNA-binding IclR family transcriptional regulator